MCLIIDEKKHENGLPIVLKEDLVVLKLMRISYSSEGVILSSCFQQNHIWEKLQPTHSILNRIWDKMEDKDVKIKMSVCPECGNAIRVAVEHTMDTKSKNEFAKEVMKYDLQVKTISLEEYRSSKVEMYCKDDCSRKSV